MNEQLDLFSIAYEEYKEEIAEPKKEQIDYRLFVGCPKCHVKPIVYKSKPQKTIDGWEARKDVASCPICGYTVADYYDIIEHWNNCNRYRVRDGKI